MSNPLPAMQCEIFICVHKTATKTTSPNIASDVDANGTANLAKVLSELKSLQTDSGTKLDNIDTCLTGMANYMGSKMTQTQWDVTSNEVQIDQGKRCIVEVEGSLEKAQAALDATIKLVTFLASKSEDLQNRRKNFWVLGVCIGRSWRPTVVFLSSMTGYRDGRYWLVTCHSFWKGCTVY